MSAAARARATVSSSSGGTAASGGGSVSWWALPSVRFHRGSSVAGPCPWVILADGPGSLFVPGFARSRCHGDGTPIRPGASGTKTAPDVPPGISRYPVSRLICGRASSAGSGSRRPAAPASRTLAQRSESTGTRWPRLRRLRRPPGRRLGGNGAGNGNTFHCGRSSATGLSPPGEQQIAAVGPAGPYRPDGLGRRPGASASTNPSKSAAQASIPDRVVIGDRGGAGRRESGTRGSRSRSASQTRPLENNITVSVVPAPGSVATDAVGDSNSQRPAYPTSPCSRRTRLVSDEAAATRVNTAVISARRFRIPAPPRQPRTTSSFRLADAHLAVGRESNPQNVRSPRLPSRRDRKASDTGITNDERGTGAGSDGSCQLTSPCTQATTWPTSPPASTAAAAPGLCSSTPRPGNRPGNGPGRAPQRSG